MDEINIGPKRDLRWPSRRWLAAAAVTGLIAVTAWLVGGGGRSHHAVPKSDSWSRVRWPSTVAAAHAPPPRAAPGTLLLTCSSANWGQLPASWRRTSLRAGSLWFVYDRPSSYVRFGRSSGAGRMAASHGKPSAGVMIVEVNDGSTVVMKPAAAVGPYFHFVDGFNGPVGNKLPEGDTGFTLNACPRGEKGPNGLVTDFYLGFFIHRGRTAPVEVQPSASSRPIWLTFGITNRRSAG